MKNYEREILNGLLTHRNVTVGQLSRTLFMSDDEVKNAISSLNKMLPAESIHVQEDHISISPKCEDLLYQLVLLEDSQSIVEYEIDLRRRCIRLFIALEQTPQNLQELSDRFFVSKNTMYFDMKQIRKGMSDYSLDLEFSRKSGYRIAGKEFSIRNRCIRDLREILRTTFGREYLKQLKFFSVHYLIEIKTILDAVEKEINVVFTDEQEQLLQYYICFILQRARKVPCSKADIFLSSMPDIRYTKEYLLITSHFHCYKFLKEADYLYIACQILSSNVIASAMEYPNAELMHMNIENFILALKKRLALEFKQETTLKNQLFLHIQPACVRLQMGLQIMNPLTGQVRSENEDIFQVIKAESETLFKNIDMSSAITDDETAYLVMMILGNLKKNKTARNTYYKAVVLCSNGTAISNLLLHTLTEVFPEIQFIGSYSFRKFAEISTQVDFIFSTLPYYSSTTTIVVPPFLTQKEIKALKSLVRELLQKDHKKKVSGLIYALKDFIQNEDLENVTCMVEDFFLLDNSQKPTHPEPKKYSSFCFTSEQVSIFNSRIEWSDLWDKAFEPLISRNSATEVYSQNGKPLFYEYFKSMLIAKNIYLLHSDGQSSSGVLDFQICIFKKPVINPDGEDIHISVSFTPPGDNSHVPLLLRLNKFFRNERLTGRMLEMDKENIARLINENII